MVSSANICISFFEVVAAGNPETDIVEVQVMQSLREGDRRLVIKRELRDALVVLGGGTDARAAGREQKRGCNSPAFHFGVLFPFFLLSALSRVNTTPRRNLTNV